jgi:ubiquinone/menaquinone biosynthesis C-methylase UbiE
VNVLDSLFARVYDRMMSPVERKGMADQRRQLLGDLSGDVLEVGAGTGSNLASYPAGVRLTVTEPSTPMVAKLRDHLTRSRPDATLVQAPAENLPFDDASFDAVVTTLVLCSVVDLAGAAAELRRVVRPDGRLVVIEHVATPGGPSLVQRVWEPAQKVVGRNCHMTRDTRSALQAAGFDTSGLLDATMPGAPAVLFPAIVGVAIPV